MEWPLPQKILRRRQAEALYDVEMFMREEGLSRFVYDEEKYLVCFPDGRFAFSRFAFSRRYADIRLLEERGY